MDYYPASESDKSLSAPTTVAKPTNPVLEHARSLPLQPEKATISRYTLGRDYHKLIKTGLKSWLFALQKRFPITNIAFCRQCTGT